MLYILHGSDTARSQQKLKEIIEIFRQKNGGDLSVYRFDAEDENPAAIHTVLESGSLFQQKKLVVIQHALRSAAFKSLKIQKFKDTKDTIVILREWELDAAGLKHVAEIKPWCSKIQEFRLQKKQDFNTSVFQLGDVFFTSRKTALRVLSELRSQGQEEFKLFSYCANHARTLLLIKSYAEMQKPVSPHHGIHPFVIKKSSALARGLSLEQISNYAQKFHEADAQIKQGIMKPREALVKILLCD